MNIVIAAVAALGVLFVYDGLCFRQQPGPGWVRRRWERLAAEAGVDLSAHAAAALCSASFFATLMLVAGLTKSLPVATIIAAGAATAPISFARSRRARRRQRFREAWPDALAMLIASVRAGVSLPEACSSLTVRGPHELRPGFTAFTTTYRATGSFLAALERVRIELSDPIADRVTAALRLAHQVGGSDLVRVLRALADFVREDLRVRKEIEARWSWTVTAARVAAAAPWIVLLLMVTRPEAASAYNTGYGVIVVVAGATVTLAGYRLMLRVARLPEERRLGQ